MVIVGPAVVVWVREHHHLTTTINWVGININNHMGRQESLNTLLPYLLVGSSIRTQQLDSCNSCSINGNGCVRTGTAALIISRNIQHSKAATASLMQEALEKFQRTCLWPWPWLWTDEVTITEWITGIHRVGCFCLLALLPRFMSITTSARPRPR